MLCSTAEKCHMKDDDLREKLNEILAGEESEESTDSRPANPKNTLALVEFKVIPCGLMSFNPLARACFYRSNFC